MKATDEKTPTVQIYVTLMDEPVDTYRPVDATSLGGDLYRIESEKTDPWEVWEFQTGAVVLCRHTRFSEGEGLLAMEAAAD